MSKLTREDVLKLARLSSLTLSDDEVEQYRTELASILDYVDQLKAVDVDGLKPTYQVSGLTNSMREDTVQPAKADAEKLLERLPSRDDRYIRVGRMI